MEALPPERDVVMTLRDFLDRGNNRGCLASLISGETRPAAPGRDEDIPSLGDRLQLSVNAMQRLVEGEGMPVFEDLHQAALLPRLLRRCSSMSAQSLAAGFERQKCASGQFLPQKLEELKTQRAIAGLRHALIKFWNEYGENIRDDLLTDGVIKSQLVPGQFEYIRTMLIEPMQRLKDNPLSSNEFLAPVQTKIPALHMKAALNMLVVIAKNHGTRELKESYGQLMQTFDTEVFPHINNLRECAAYQPLAMQRP